jgi:hypothetical protein
MGVDCCEPIPSTPTTTPAPSPTTASTCAVGYWGTSNMSTCQACPENSTSLAGSIGYEYCYCINGVGQWGDTIFDEYREVWEHVLVCPPPFECVAGKYSSAVGASAASTCIACAAGTYSETVGASSNRTCIDCAAGTYSSEGDSTCTDCAAGKYSNATGKSACQRCGVGKYILGSSAMVASSAMSRTRTMSTARWLRPHSIRRIIIVRIGG